MHRHLSDPHVHASARALDRRSILIGLSGALLVAGLPTLPAAAKKGKKRCKRKAKFCRSDILEVCDRHSGNTERECRADVTRCCNKLKKCKPNQVAIDCCEKAGWCL